MLLIWVFAVACQPIASTDRVAHRVAATPSPSPSPSGPPPVDCAKSKCLALTFDDGPGPYTAHLLDMLKARSARVTFFVVGRNAAANPRLLRREVAERHEIGNHTYDHADLVKLSDSRIRNEIQRTQRIVHEETGHWPTIMRPPYGATDKRVRRVAGLPEIMWRGDTLDWLHKNPARVRHAVLKLAKRNAVILVHDVKKTTVAAMPRTLNALMERGYTLVTVSELYGDGHLRRGHFYGLD